MTEPALRAARVAHTALVTGAAIARRLAALGVALAMDGGLLL